MASILIVFGSTSDNTESVAQQIGSTLSNGPHTVAFKNVTNTKFEGLGSGHDLISPISSRMLLWRRLSRWTRRIEAPLESRIIRLVDAFDSMTSNRPYRSKMSHH